MSTQHLTLVGQISWTEGYVTATRFAQVPLSDGDLHVMATIPVFPLGQTRVVLVPAASLSGTTLSLDLSRWDMFDLDSGRNVGIGITSTDPAAPENLRIAERYARDARHLDSQALEEWVAALLAQVNA